MNVNDYTEIWWNGIKTMVPTPMRFGWKKAISVEEAMLKVDRAPTTAVAFKAAMGRWGVVCPGRTSTMMPDNYIGEVWTYELPDEAVEMFPCIIYMLAVQLNS